MEPITMIVTAIATGAAAIMKPTAEQIVKDAYTELKAIIQRKYQQVSVATIENNPASKERQNILTEDLKATQADKDEEVLHQAQSLLKIIEQQSPQLAEEVGLRIEDVKVGASLKIREIIAQRGIGAEIKRTEIMQDLEIGKVQTGGVDSSPK
jgi:hypothetical protein